MVIVEGEWAVWGMNLRCPIVNNGEFVVSLCGSAYSDRAVIWHGEWVGPGIHVLDGSPHASRGGCCFWRGFWHRSAFSSNKYPDILISIINSCVKNWQYFRLHGIPLNSASNSLSLVRFKIEVGVDTKCMCKT